MGAAGPSGDFEIREDNRNDLGQSVVPGEPDLVGNTVDGGSSAAQLPQKNILERKEVLIGRRLICMCLIPSCHMKVLIITSSVNRPPVASCGLSLRSGSC